MLLAAGVDAEEAVGLLSEDSAQNDFYDAAKAVQKEMLEGTPQLSKAMEKTEYFPVHACRMLEAGEKTGRSEAVLGSLADYYESRDRLARKLRSAVTYPLVLLVLTAAILVLLLARVLPVFTNVYKSLYGGMTASSYLYLRAAYIIGAVALVIAILLGIFLLICLLASRSSVGREKLISMISGFAPAGAAVKKLSLAHFTQVLSLFVASGADADTSIAAAEELVTDAATKKKVAETRQYMKDENVGLSRAIYDKKLFEPLYARLFLSAVKSGTTEQMLSKLAKDFGEEADTAVDGLIDSIEPIISGFLTVAVAIVLLATMLPLIGVLGAI